MYSRHNFHQHNAHPAPVEKGIRCPDLVALVTFGDDARVQCGLSSAFDPAFAAKVVGLGKVTPGWTNIAAGMRAATDLLNAAPRGLRKRMWVLSDGRATHQVERIMPEAHRARERWININTIGFGDPNQFDEAMLKAVAGATHNGKFMLADTAEKLGEIFRKSAGRADHQRMTKGEATAFVIDTSGSMFCETMNGRRKIDVVISAMTGLITWKQKIWS